MIDVAIEITADPVHVDQVVTLPPADLRKALLVTDFNAQDIPFNEYDWAFNDGD